jgi:hypothetical protein
VTVRSSSVTPQSSSSSEDSQGFLQKKMFRIPEEVFEHQILQFLKLHETLALLTSSNRRFEQFRYRSGKRNFKVGSSDLTKAKFINLWQKINPAENLIVRCNYCVREKIHCRDILDNGFTMNGHPLLPRRVCTCPWCCFIPATDVSQIQELSLYDCQVTNVNCFSHLTWLSWQDCDHINDVHSLETFRI